MKRTALMTILLAAGTAAYAETQQKPALVSDVQASAQDSPLVHAAKRTVGTRRKAGTAPIAVITNATVAKSTTVLTTSSGAAKIPDYSAKNTYTPSTSAPAPAPAAQSAAPYRVSRAALEGYALQAASDPCVPPLSQNTSSGSASRMAQNSGYDATAPRTAQNSSSARPQNSASDATAPRTATNSSDGPPPSQNAGPYRPPRP